MLYIRLIGKLTDYPIPYLRLPPGEGKRFLEIGCNWGRWCIAAARMGYRPVGIDPSLKGIRAARQVALHLGIQAHYVAADGRLPFANRTFDQVLSYSVLRIFPRRMPASHCGRLAERCVHLGDFLCKCQIALAFVVFIIKSAEDSARATISMCVTGRPENWPRLSARPWDLLAFLWTVSFRSTQISDARFLAWNYRTVVYASEALRRISGIVPPLTYLADSLYVEGTKGR
jgi:SAM-dependent methyltransferase